MLALRILLIASCWGGVDPAGERTGHRRIEVSPDGLQTVLLDDQPAESPPASRYEGIPYLSTPDWQNTLRRQVGAVAIGDMNGDGRNDVVVGCYTSASYPPYPDWENLIYYNTGTTLEAEPSWISADEVHTGDIQVGDINMDGYLDIFSANGGSAFSPSVVYFGGPGGPSTTPGWTASLPAASWSTAAVLFDFDHDDDLDVFTTNQGVSPTPTRPIYGFRNNNGVLATSPFFISADPAVQNGLAFADYNGNGWEDLAGAKWVNYQTGIYLNSGGTLATSPAWTTGVTSGDRGVAWADVDNNGWPDLAAGRSPVVLYSNNAGTLTQTWTATPTGPSNPEDLKFADIDRDGDPDLAEIYFSSGAVHIYLNTNGLLNPVPVNVYDDPSAGTAIAFGDLNGDNWPDMVVGLSGEPSVKVFFARIPDVPGDMDCDGLVNTLDVDPFVLALLDASAYSAAHPFCQIGRGDLLADGFVDGQDIQPFVGLLTTP